MLVESAPISVQQSAKFIAENSTCVRVDEQACSTVADKIYSQMQQEQYTTHTWAEHELNPRDKSVATVDWIFLVDTLNFSFWTERTEEERYAVRYNGELYTGYWTLPAAVNRALADEIPITSPEFWTSPDFTLDQFAQIFRSANAEQMPLLEERFRVLKETGAALASLGATSAASLVSMADHSAVKLLDLLVKHFPSYRDVTTYKGRDVSILKRAQIFIGDLWACFNGEGYGQFYDIDKLTMFADYRVPQILYTLGCIHYSPELEQKIRTGTHLVPGSMEEIELRGCSIWAVELMAAELRKYTDTVNSVLIDFYLWDTAKKQEKEATMPVHRVRSIYY